MKGLIEIKNYSLYYDDDGWILQINEEDPFYHFLHRLDFATLDKVLVKGSSEISFAGIVPFDLQPSSFFPVGFNVTFMCPDGMSFEQDWFVRPYVVSTCQVQQHCKNLQFG